MLASTAARGRPALLLVAAVTVLLAFVPLFAAVGSAAAADRPAVRDDEILLKFKLDVPAALQLAAGEGDQPEPRRPV